MTEKPPGPHHLENPSSIEEQDSTDAEIAQTWSKDVKVDQSSNLKNPLVGLSKEELFADVEAFAEEKGLQHIVDDMKKGALVAQDPRSFESLAELSDSEKVLLRREKTHRWSQPFMMYFMTSQLPDLPW